MKNYIEFYLSEDQKVVAEIHKQGTCRRITNQQNIRVLLEICKKYGIIIEEECILNSHVFSISKEYEEYARKKKKTATLKVFNSPHPNMKMSRKNPGLGKAIVATSLAAIITITGISISHSKTDQEDVITPEEVTVLYDEQIQPDDYSIMEEDKEEELQAMVQREAFHFSYQDRTHEENIQNAKRYEALFEKYAHRYGLDPNLLMAVAAQESCGEHESNLGNGPAEGIMQVEKSVYIGHSISAYNFETGEEETIQITAEKLQDLETNIQIGAMILRICIENNDYNIPLALQTYNFGPGNMNTVLSNCSEQKQISVQELRSSATNNSWLDYRASLEIGDPQYVEHVFSFLENNTTLTVNKRNNEPVSVQITNDYQRSNQIAVG